MSVGARGRPRPWCPFPALGLSGTAREPWRHPGYRNGPVEGRVSTVAGRIATGPKRRTPGTRRPRCCRRRCGKGQNTRLRPIGGPVSPPDGHHGCRTDSENELRLLDDAGVAGQGITGRPDPPGSARRRRTACGRRTGSARAGTRRTPRPACGGEGRRPPESPSPRPGGNGRWAGYAPFESVQARIVRIRHGQVQHVTMPRSRCRGSSSP